MTSYFYYIGVALGWSLLGLAVGVSFGLSPMGHATCGHTWCGWQVLLPVISLAFAVIGMFATAWLKHKYENIVAFTVGFSVISLPQVVGCSVLILLAGSFQTRFPALLMSWVLLIWVAVFIFRKRSGT